MCKCNVEYAVDDELSFCRRTLTRVIITMSISLIVSIILLFATNIIWLCEWCSYDYVTVESEGGGNANYIGDDGLIIGGDN